jgi:hypothetical protein
VNVYVATRQNKKKKRKKTNKQRGPLPMFAFPLVKNTSIYLAKAF